MQLRNSLLLTGLLLTFLSAMGQATSLTIDNQSPGWLSSKINYGDQKTVRNLCVTGYLNKSDYEFIATLIQEHELHGHIDLSETDFVGDTKSGTSDNVIDFTFQASLDQVKVEFFSMPKSAEKITSFSFYYFGIDSVEVGGPNMVKLSAPTYQASYLKVRDGVKSMEDAYFAGPITQSGILENNVMKTVILPKSIEIIPHGRFAGFTALQNFEFPSWVQELGEYVFACNTFIEGKTVALENCNMLYMNSFYKSLPKEIYLSSNLTYINNFYQYYSGSFTQIPVVSEGDDITLCIYSKELVWKNGGTGKGFTIFVPNNLVEEYRNSYDWKDATIIANQDVEDIILSLPEYIYVGDVLNFNYEVLPVGAKDFIDVNTVSNKIVRLNENQFEVVNSGSEQVCLKAKFTGFQKFVDFEIYDHTTGIQISEREAKLHKKEQYRIVANTLPLGTSDNRLYSYSTDDNVATVNAEGIVTAENLGVCYITIRSVDREYESTFRVEVVPAEAQEIYLDYSQLTIEIDQTKQLIATILPPDASENKLLWNSTDKTVVDVDAEGVVKGIGMGNAVVSAYCGTVFANCFVTVNKIPQEIVWEQAFEEVKVGDEIVLTAYSTSGLSVTYEIASGSSIASINNNVLSILGEGLIEITAAQTGDYKFETAMGVKKSIMVVAGIESVVPDDNGRYIVYNLQGVLMLDTVDIEEIKSLEQGIYIINGVKVVK